MLQNILNDLETGQVLVDKLKGDHLLTLSGAQYVVKNSKELSDTDKQLILEYLK